MTYHVILPVIIAFAVSALLGPVVIPFLRRLKVGQTERKEPESNEEIGKMTFEEALERIKQKM